ncbi:hypothetical protein AAZV13_07G191650 [Glycine max]
MLGGVLFVSLMDDLEKHLESRGYTLIWGSLLSSSTCVFLLFSFFCSIHLIQYVSLVLSLRVDVAESKHYRLSNQFLNLMTKHYSDCIVNCLMPLYAKYPIVVTFLMLKDPTRWSNSLLNLFRAKPRQELNVFNQYDKEACSVHVIVVLDTIHVRHFKYF